MNKISANNYSLQNPENYKTNFENSLNETTDKYIALICEYFRCIIENIKMKNAFHFKFILIRGLETITHVFNITLLYSKNLEMAYYHSQKAFYYYVEFIGQINEEKHVFLQLSSKDAIMCVYKKTIFEISNEYKKSFTSTCTTKEVMDKFDGIQLNINIYKNIVNYLFTNENKIQEDVIDFFIYRFEILCNKINSVILSNDETKIIDLFICNLNSKLLENEKYLDILDLFTKKICKTKAILSEKKIKQKILEEDFDLFLKQGHDKFINWIFS
jgi:hypothetical protein